jgi:hypothetical protein
VVTHRSPPRPATRLRTAAPPTPVTGTMTELWSLIRMNVPMPGKYSFKFFSTVRVTFSYRVKYDKGKLMNKFLASTLLDCHAYGRRVTEFLLSHHTLSGFQKIKKIKNKKFCFLNKMLQLTVKEASLGCQYPEPQIICSHNIQRHTVVDTRFSLNVST